MENDISLIALLAFSTLLPFLIASGTCFVKFSVVFIMMRNALGLQQVPSNMVLNGVALMLSAFVMYPVTQQALDYYQNNSVNFRDADSVSDFVEHGLGRYREYLSRYSDKDLVAFFEDAQHQRVSREEAPAAPEGEQASILSLLPAYALSEIKSAFRICFYLYLPFVVVDLVISSVLLALGMMMMSPVTISTPVKLILFVAMDGWTLLSRGLVMQYMDLVKG
ncbi:EscR/YscR/HrcR family type III secretion system export apparatus protein [Salmonella enterica]|nr:EscR/YscR/HrcR family type III secretion system export apparatus protein [Salmonella enterica subsp. enterica serovar Braenderup]EEA7255005.1 EscR/YscR/HrcR family type III secretion system export apparatus protein [Salmonella enterica subsp. enterica]